jgi:hypothetical protein
MARPPPRLGLGTGSLSPTACCWISPNFIGEIHRRGCLVPPGGSPAGLPPRHRTSQRPGSAGGGPRHSQEAAARPLAKGLAFRSPPAGIRSRKFPSAARPPSPASLRASGTSPCGRNFVPGSAELRLRRTACSRFFEGAPPPVPRRRSCGGSSTPGPTPFDSGTNFRPVVLAPAGVLARYARRSPPRAEADFGRDRSAIRCARVTPTVSEYETLLFLLVSSLCRRELSSRGRAGVRRRGRGRGRRRRRRG